MTTSTGNAYRDDPSAAENRLNAQRRLSSEIEKARSNIMITLGAIALVTLPTIFFGTRDIFVTTFAACLILVCGAYILVRFHQAARRERRSLAEDRS